VAKNDAQPAEAEVQNKPAAPKTRRKKGHRRAANSKRTRTPRIYPALSFEESLVLAEAIHTHASGEKVSRLTLLKAMNLSPTSSATQILITSSGKYGITKGSFVAEHLELIDTLRRRVSGCGGRESDSPLHPARGPARA
jgi:hypothetical protein